MEKRLFLWIYARSVTTTGGNRLAVSFIFVTDNTGIEQSWFENGGDWQEQVAEYQYDPSNDVDLTLQLQTANMASAGTISCGFA